AAFPRHRLLGVGLCQPAVAASVTMRAAANVFDMDVPPVFPAVPLDLRRHGASGFDATHAERFRTPSAPIRVSSDTGERKPFINEYSHGNEEHAEAAGEAHQGKRPVGQGCQGRRSGYVSTL